MDSVLKSDIFFFITSATVLAVGFLLMIACLYLINILRDMRAVSKTFRTQAQELAKDFSQVHEKFKTGISSFWQRMFRGKTGGRKKH